MCVRTETDAAKARRRHRTYRVVSLLTPLTSERYERVIMMFTPQTAEEREWFNIYIQARIRPGGHIEWKV